MIKVISNSDSLSTWYLDPGVTSGDGTTKEAPIVWSEEATENGTKLTYPIKQNSGYESSRVYILVTLKAGTSYSFYMNSSYGPMNGELFKQTDLNTVIGNYYYYDTNTINVSEDGNYILGIWYSFSYDVTDYLTLTPAPETTVGEAGWKKKTGLVDGSGWNLKTGKLFKYRSIEMAEIKFNDFPKDGLILYYNMDDENSTCVDTVNGYNMTIQAGSGLTYGNDGKFGKCWESTGYSYLKCNTAPNITDNFSINLWMYKTVNTGGPNSTIFELGTHASNTGFGFYLSGSNITWRLNQLYQYYVSDVIPLNEWIMLSYTFDGNYCRVYKNANIIIETSNTQKPNLSNVIVAFARSDSSTSEDYRGKLDEIGVWNRALSLEELNKLYNNNKGSIFK